MSDTTRHQESDAVLPRSEASFRSLCAAVPIGIFLTDPDGRTIYTNECLQALSGLTAGECLGWGWTRVIHPDDREGAIEQAVESARKGEPFSREFRIVRLDGAVRWICATRVPMSSADGTLIGKVGTVEDITERKEAERAARESSAVLAEVVEEQNVLLDNARDFVYRHDVDGVFTYLSPAVEQVTGYRVDEWWNHYTTYMTDHPVNEKVVAVTEQALRTGREAPPYLVEIVHKSGHPIMLEVIERPYLDKGLVKGIVGVARDVTERIRAAAEVTKAKEAAESASRAKSAFLANVSHEIRTPLMAILAAAERSAETVQTDRTSYGDTILRNARHLISLVDDLLDAARMEAGRLTVELSTCSLFEIIDDVRAVTTLYGREHVGFRIVYESQIPKAIHTDARRLRQALINLIGNALKFTHSGHVHVRIKVVPDAEEPRLSIAVEDTGIGIPKKSRDLVFEPFGQLETPAQRLEPTVDGLNQGVGLGLPLTKWIAQRLGGRLEFVSNVGKGSTFTLQVATGPLDDVDWIDPTPESYDTVPRCPVKEKVVHAPGPCKHEVAATDGKDSMPGIMRGRILLAEDSRDVRELMRGALVDAGAEVTAVADGRYAVDTAAKETFDLILLDLQMPGLNGLEAAAEIRRLGCRTAMIAVTAWTEPSDRARMFEAGFDDIWPKPFSIRDVVDQAGAYLESVPAEVSTSSSLGEGRSPAGISKGQWAEIQSGFVASLPSRTSRLRSALDSSDATGVHEVLHQLVGSSGVCGFMSLSQEAARLLALTDVRASTAAAEGGVDCPINMKTAEPLLRMMSDLSERRSSDLPQA